MFYYPGGRMGHKQRSRGSAKKSRRVAARNRRKHHAHAPRNSRVAHGGTGNGVRAGEIGDIIRRSNEAMQTRIAEANHGWGRSLNW